MKAITKLLISIFIIIEMVACSGPKKDGAESATRTESNVNDSTVHNQNDESSAVIAGGEKPAGSGAEPFTELWFQAREKALVEKIDAARAKRTSEPVRIRGTILNAAGLAITLDKLGGEERFAPISTTTINEDGVFELKAETNQPQMFQLRFDGNKSIPLFLEGGTYEVEADYDKWQNFKINSPQSYQLKEFFDILELHNERVAKLKERQDAITDGDHLEAFLRDTVRPLQAEIEEKKFKALKNFIENNKSSVLAVEAANRLDIVKRIDYVKMVFDRTYKLYPYSSYVKQLGKHVIRYDHLLTGSQMPDFTLPDLKGKNYTLSDYRGKYVLIHMSTAYFHQVRDYHEGLKPIYKRFNSFGFEIIGVCIDDNEEAFADIVEKDNLPWPVVSDLLGGYSIIQTMYPALDPPMTYLLDREGKLVAKGLTLDELENTLEKELF